MDASEGTGGDSNINAVEGFIEEEDIDTVYRQKWTINLDLILSSLGTSVGLGNLWRFPYLCYKNGGGAFLIPFLIFVLLVGVPMLVLESGLGQYMGLSGPKAWNICPVFQRIALSNFITCTLRNIYYIMVIAWAGYYFVLSLTSVLPWSTCNNEWNTPRCIPYNAAVNTSSSDASVEKVAADQPVDPAVECWERGVLQMTSDITDGGGIVWQLVLSLLVVWVIVCLFVWKGIRWRGKVQYFTALFPYVMLCILLVRGLTLDGATDGVSYFITPDLSRLADMQVWVDGGTQVFFSFAVAINAMVTVASYNRFGNNFYRDAILVSCINTVTSLVGGLAVFSVLGFMAKQHNIPIEDVANAGPGLAFITYPIAITQLPVYPLWAALSFLMLIVIGLDSQLTTVGKIISSVLDFSPRLLRRQNRRFILVVAYCLLSFLIGISFASRGGIYIFQLFDYYSASGMVILWIVFWELVAIAWVFGVDRFYDAIEMMIGSRINPYLHFCWKYLSPTLCLTLLLAPLIMYRPLRYNKTYEYPNWAQGFGIMLSVLSMLCIPLYGSYKLATTEGSLSQRWRKVTTPVLRKHQIRKSWGITAETHDSDED